MTTAKPKLARMLWGLTALGLLAAAPAPAPAPVADAPTPKPADVSAFKDKLRLYGDGKGHYLTAAIGN